MKIVFMKPYFFAIRDNKIDYCLDGAAGSMLQYLRYYNPSAKEIIDYKIENVEVSSIVCQAENMAYALAAVERFLCYQVISQCA